MNNFTIEDYKTAIRAKYKVAIEEDVSGILSDPTPSELRDFYLRLLVKGLSKIDEEIMKLFLRADDKSSLKKTIEDCNIEKLKPIIYFLQGKNTESRQRIEMAAILVNFQLRPFKKFQEEKGIIKENEPIPPLNKPDSTTTQKEHDDGAKDNAGKDEVTIVGVQTDIEPPKGQSPNRFTKKQKFIIKGIIIVFGLSLGFLISHYVFPKKQCMQWSDDHYEKVDCEPKVNGIAIFNLIDPFDERQFELRKIKVCDTTTCFKNGQPIVWYGKINNKVDFYNIDGKNPLNGKMLRPITSHMFTKYKKSCASK
jgi:hypothetical protein